MNKALCTLLLIIGFTEVFAQVNLTLDEYNQFVDEKKRLKDTVEQFETDIIDLTSQIDSLSSAQRTLTRINLKLEAERDSLRTNLKIVQYDIGSLEKSNAAERKIHQELKSTLNQKLNELAELEKEKEKSNRVNYLKGRQDILNTLTQSYELLSFDEMVRASSQDQIRRDLRLINTGELNQKLKNLDTYFSGNEVLTQKYVPSNVQYELEMARLIKENSVLVEELIENLDNYKLRNDGLKEAIQKIQIIDEKFIANTEKDQKDKEALILAEISWYLYNYEFDFEDYPYLSSIVIEIMKVKHKDANSDISGMLKQL